MPTSPKRIGFLATGTELTIGETVNTNSPALAKQLVSLGAHIGDHILCGDDAENLRDALTFLGKTHHAIIVIGGLGPTSDDCTRDLLAEFAKVPLVFHSSAWQWIQDRFQKKYPQLTDIPTSNQRQAYFPAGAQTFENRHGSAWGFHLQTLTHDLIALPGPPHECLPMFESAVLPLLQAREYFSDSGLYVWRVTGISEALIAEQLDSVTHPLGIQLGYRAHAPFVDIKCWISHTHEHLSHVLTCIETVIKPYQVEISPANPPIQR